jgi:hypothetical protein
MADYGKRDFIAAGVAALCIAPSAVCNVAPHIAHAAADAGAASMAAFQGVSVLTMAAMPFATKNVTATAHKLACYLLAVVLLGLNFANALDMANRQRETATGASRATIQKAAALNSRLAGLRESRKQVPPFSFTSAASASAAQSAADETARIQDRSCERRGRKCEARTAEAAASRTKLTAILEQRTLTERAEKLDADIAKAERELADLGPVPQHADASASQITRVASLFVAANDEDVAIWRPVAFAAGIELLALIGPLGMFAAFAAGSFARQKGEVPHGPEIDRVKTCGDLVKPQKITTPAPENTPLTPTAAQSAASLPAKPAKTKTALRRAKAKEPLGDVRIWFETRTTARARHEVRCNEAYNHYTKWCGTRGEAPASLTRFGMTLKNELGVAYAERGKRGYYSGIALKGALQLAVSNA